MGLRGPFSTVRLIIYCFGTPLTLAPLILYPLLLPLLLCPQISAAKRNLEDSTAIAELEMAALRTKALAAAEEESKVWAEAQKVAIRQRKLDEATEQVVRIRLRG